MPRVLVAPAAQEDSTAGRTALRPAITFQNPFGAGLVVLCDSILPDGGIKKLDVDFSRFLLEIQVEKGQKEKTRARAHAARGQQRQQISKRSWIRRMFTPPFKRARCREDDPFNLLRREDQGSNKHCARKKRSRVRCRCS